jgi:hypothetical protein
VDHLRLQRAEYKNEGSVGVAAIYMKSGRFGKLEQPLEAVLQDIVEQLKEERQQRGAILRSVKEFHERLQAQSDWPSPDEVITALSSLVETYQKAFILVDSIHESSGEKFDRVCLTGYVNSNLKFIPWSRLILPTVSKESSEISSNWKLELKKWISIKRS